MSVKIQKDVLQVICGYMSAGVLLESTALCWERMGDQTLAHAVRSNANIEFFNAVTLLREHGIEVEGMKVREGGAA